jgi:putative ABC transport system permease protein
MISHSLKMTLRGYLRNRTFTLLNLTNLVIGLFVAYTAISYIGFEWSYDKFHQNSDNIYRVEWTYRSQDYSIIGFPGSGSNADEQARQAQAFKSAMGIKEVVQFVVSPTAAFIQSDDKKIEIKNVLTTNTPAAFSNVFTWTLKHGSFKNFGEGTKKALLTASVVEKLYGKDALNTGTAIDKLVKIAGEDYLVAAIIEDVPLNANFDFSVALNNPTINYWGCHVYVEKDKASNVQNVENQLNSAFAAFNPKVVKDVLYKKHSLQPIANIHFRENVLYELKPTGNSRYITLIGFFALLITLITLFNYANLTLAIKSKQSKNIGIIKAIGAKSSSISAQFILESVLLSLIALPITAVLIQLLIPFFNTFMSTDISANVLTNLQTFFLLFALAVSIGALASIFPAFYLSKKDTLTLFKEGLRSNNFQRFPIRRYLIASQFVILISITSISYFIHQQIKFIDNKNIGFRKEGILYAYTSEDKQAVFQEKLRQMPEIKAVGNGSTFGIEPFNQTTYKMEGIDVVFDDANQLYLDYEAIKAYDLKTTLTAPTTTAATLINRTAAEKLAKLKGISADKLIGTTIITEPEYTDATTGRVGFPFTIAGIFEDINLFSLHNKIEPYFITVSERVRLDGRSIVLFDAANTAKVVKNINAIHAELNQTTPLDIEFLDENLAKLYTQDQRTANLLLYFNIIAVFLASLGIIGITLFLTVARTKEIGIRKVLGASPFSIIQILTNEYIYIVGIALVISVPIALYVTNTWLSNFAYRIDIPYFMVLIVGVLTFTLTALVVGIVAYKAAVANPVKSLRTE